MSARIILFARFPEPGRAKTRLIPALGAERAAELHRRLTERIVAELRASGLPWSVAVTGAPLADFARWLGAADLFDQGEGDLGERLARIAPPVIFIGADIPDLAVAHLRAAAAAVGAGRVVVGPAEDGGYYLLGLPAPMPFLFGDMPWGTDRVFGETVARLDARGIAPVLLEPLADLDRPEDLARWPDLA